ncbi:MAG: nickel ABC transporter permease [Pseudomonadota bacterium]
MIRFIFLRALSALGVIVGVSCIVFVLSHVIPGDPVEVMLGEYAAPADREALTKRLGLDKPIWEQFVSYMGQLVRFDLGESLHSKRPIVETLAERLPATAWLAFVSMVIAIVIAVPLGCLAALKQNSVWDALAVGFSVFGVAIPNFVFGPLAILVFAVGLGWFPVSGNETPLAVVLPALTLGTAMAAILARMVRASLLDVLREDYVRTARAKGLSDIDVVWRHALRNALLPVVTIVGLQLGALLAGAVVTEQVFSWPGIGELTIESIRRRDYPVLQGCVLVIAITYVIINTLTDVVYAWVDPRIRLNSDNHS